MLTSLSTLADNLSNRIHDKLNVIVVILILNRLEERKVECYSLTALIVKESILKNLMKN